MGVVLFPYPYQLSSVLSKSLSTTRLVSLLLYRSSTPCLYLPVSHRSLRTPVRYTNLALPPLPFDNTATLDFSPSFR